MRAFLLVLFFAALAGPRPAAAVDQQKYFRKHLDSLTGKQYWLREVVNSSPKVYCETDGVQTYFVHEYSPLYRLTRKVEVTVEELQYDEAYNLLLMIFRHRKMGCGAITFHWPENVTPSVRTLENMMRYAFSESGEADDFKTYVGNSLSQVLHYAGCNHLPPEQYREEFATVGAAEENEYRQCNLCFANYPRIPDYELEMYLGRKTVGNLLSQSSRSSSQRLRNRVRKAGERVLENWPYTLRGYDYFFDVLSSRVVNACACPGGWVFINTGLLYAIESENELESVLAHEIAHVERRHGLRQLRRNEKIDFWSSLAAEVANKIAIEKTGGFEGKYRFLGFINELSTMASQIAMQGYSREYEQEADIYAINYMKKVRNDDISHILFEKKTQYYANLMGQTEDEEDKPLLRSHPYADYRIQLAENARIEDFGSGLTFKAYDRDGELVAELVLESQCVTKVVTRAETSRSALTSYYAAGRGYRNKTMDRLYLFGTIRTTTALSDSCEIRDIKIKCGEKTVKLDNREDTVLIPLYETGCAFERDTDELLECIDGIELKLPDVKQWRKEE